MHPVGFMRAVSLLFLAAGLAGPGAADVLTPTLAPARQNDWFFTEGDWHLSGGVLEQRDAGRGAVALLKEPSFADFRLSADLNVHAAGSGVRAAALLFRAAGTRTHYWLHLDARNGNAILVRSTPANPWIELTRRPLRISLDEWHTVQVECAGPKIAVTFDGKPVLQAEERTLAAGRIGIGTSQGQVSFRNLKVEGEPVKGAEPLKIETSPYRVISRGEAAGTYQAFPDVCRLQNGDLLCVFYAGYGHVSLPIAAWPKGGRVCMVRSTDEGRTWSAPAVLFDGPDDDRDPHIARTSDGTLWCSFFSYRRKEGKTEFETNVVRSTDGGATWETTPRTLAPRWAVSAPVRELPDGTYLLGVYAEGTAGASWGGVLRSTDRGRTWSAPIPIGEKAGLPLDAETDVVRLKDGTLYAALRSSKVNMHYATSTDGGLTWSAVRDIGFQAHCPHFTRLSTGEILLSHRLPATSLHVSRDEGKSWQGPYPLDSVGGAYPSTVELKDGSILAVYYEEGAGSAIRALRFRLKPDGIEPVGWE